MAASRIEKVRWLPWAVFALLLLFLPLVFKGQMALAIGSQIGIAIIACLSFNILLGQGGMLSFGHAVYTGLGAFAVIHLLNLAGAGKLPLPVSLMPLAGGFFSLAVAAVLGFVTTRKAGTTFAMITLGVCELVFALSLIIPEFFGGESGVSSNRVVGEKFLGLSFGPPIEVYYLIALYAFGASLLMFLFTDTPVGRMLTAVRDNPERVEFIGFNTQRVRYLGFLAASFFAGVAGGLAAINFELVTPESVGAGQSGAYLLFTFMGGTTLFYGPIIGAVMMVVATVLLSEWTKAWLLYLGLFFMVVVMFAPGGVASLIEANMKVLRAKRFKGLALPYLALATAGAVLAGGMAALVEMLYHTQLDGAITPYLRFLGMTLDTTSLGVWLKCGGVAIAGVAATWAAAKLFRARWEAAHGEHPASASEGGA